MSRPATKRYMLYIAADHDDASRLCAGSRECISLIRTNPIILSHTRFENVDVIRRENLPIPAWLYGTPTLVDTVNYRIHRGSGALDYLLVIAENNQPTPTDGDAREAGSESTPYHQTHTTASQEEQ